ncbi:hypothetical protein VKT23_012516 [Stygiomarasmius scandens]|uniref:GH18 domain-containing protein n=1 Tax=Marasmiellus scandens TaxID=2682957 RepID=A0ABR1J5V4_9AGAR
MQHWNVLVALIIGLLSLGETTAIPVKGFGTENSLVARDSKITSELLYRDAAKSVFSRSPVPPEDDAVDPSQDSSEDPTDDPADDPSEDSSETTSPATGTTSSSAAAGTPWTPTESSAPDPGTGTGPASGGTSGSLPPDGTAPASTAPDSTPTDPTSSTSEDDPADSGSDEKSDTSGGGSSNFPAPYFVVYNDVGSEPAPDPSKIKGFNVLNLAFWMSTTGPVDKAQEWQSLDSGQRKSIKQKYKQAGIKIMASAFGATDAPTQQDPQAVAKKISDFVIKSELDGIDIDYEDFPAVDTGKAGDWLIKLTKALRQQLPQGKYLLTHAPVAPWFGKGKLYAQVDKAVGKMIDWYNVQFYNQGASAYVDCNGLFNSASDGTAVFQIHKSLGIPLEKLVVGKPAVQKDANNGYMEPSALGKCVAQAKKQGWNGGVMSWQYPNADSQWIKAANGGGSAKSGTTGPESKDDRPTATTTPDAPDTEANPTDSNDPTATTTPDDPDTEANPTDSDDPTATTAPDDPESDPADSNDPTATTPDDSDTEADPATSPDSTVPEGDANGDDSTVPSSTTAGSTGTAATDPSVPTEPQTPGAPAKRRFARRSRVVF